MFSLFQMVVHFRQAATTVHLTEVEPSDPAFGGVGITRLFPLSTSLPFLYFIFHVLYLP